MNTPSDALSIWYWADGHTDYIVAAGDVDGAARAFDRVAICRGQTPQPCPQARLGRTGFELATSHPGVIYRRLPSSPAVGS